MCLANICRLNERGVRCHRSGGVIPGPLKETDAELLPCERVCVTARAPHRALESFSQGNEIFAH